MKRKIVVIFVIGLVIVFMLAGLIAPLASKQQTENSTSNKAENSIESNTINNEKEASSNNEKEASSGNAGSNTKKSDDNSEDSSSDTSQSESQSQASSEDSPVIPTIDFPYAISGTDLVVEQIGSYDGYFIEDGSDREVSGIAAIVLKNNGGNINFVGIGISQGARSLAFTGSLIPAGATIIVQEQSGAEHSQDPYYSATATIELVDRFEMSRDLISVKDNGKNELIVTNYSSKTIPCVKIFFKNYLPDENVYVGGIAYSITLEDVEPETSTEVSATHYDSKYSAIMKISVEQ